MVAVTWSALGLLAAALFGSFFCLGNRLDSLSHALGARIDGLDHSLAGRIDGLATRLDTHLDRHGPQRRAR
jgi:hypothetical protein